MVFFDCIILSFERVNGKLDGYCRVEQPRRETKEAEEIFHSHLKHYPQLKLVMDYTHCFACLIF